MRNKLKFIGNILFILGIVFMVMQVHYLENMSKLFAFPFFIISIGSAMNIPKAYYELKNDRRNALQIRKYFVGSVLVSILSFIIFIVLLIRL